MLIKKHFVDTNENNKEIYICLSKQMRVKRLKKGDNISSSPRGIKGEALPLHNFYNPKLKPLAHGHRYEMTKAEACL